MRLYIKQKVFSWSDRFDIYDANHNVAYYAQGEVFSLWKKLRVYDGSDRQIAYIEELPALVLPRFTVYISGREVAQVKTNPVIFGVPLTTAIIP